MADTRTLKDMRTAAGVTQRDVAAALNVSVPAVYRWENGTATPSIEKLPMLAGLLNMSMDNLVGILIRTKGA